jgi:hypothetical protein
MKYSILHKSGQHLAYGVNETTVRTILRNVGPIACTVFADGQIEESLNGVEWLIDNPGDR